MRKTFIFILTHGMWGQELITSTEQFLGGSVSDIHAFPLMPETSLEVYRSSIETVMEAHPEHDFLCLVDILGGTPCNISSYYIYTHDIEAVSGLNMDMLITILELRRQVPCSQIPERLFTEYEHTHRYMVDLKTLLLNHDKTDN